MTDMELVAKLEEALSGSGCRVEGPHQVWAVGSQLTDEHVSKLEGWAQLEYFVADETSITDASLPILGSFPLEELSLGDTKVTADGILGTAWPNSLLEFSFCGIDFKGKDISPLLEFKSLTDINANYCGLSEDDVRQLAQLPNLGSLEAFGAKISKEVAIELSTEFSDVLFRFDDGVWAGGEIIVPHRNLEDEED